MILKETKNTVFVITAVPDKVFLFHIKLLCHTENVKQHPDIILTKLFKLDIPLSNIYGNEISTGKTNLRTRT